MTCWFLFVSGFSDNVKCFYCNGGLRNWEKGDDPWHEHARWFQTCRYVLNVKGQDYVNSVRAENQEDAPILAQARRNVRVELRREKTCLRGFRPGPTQTGPYNYRK